MRRTNQGRLSRQLSFLRCGGRFGANGGRQRASETRFRPVALGAVALLSLHLSVAHVFAQDLNSFGVLAGSTVTSTGASAISGNVGVSPGSAVTGLLPAQVTNGTIHAADAVAGQAQSDLSVLYTVLSGRPTTQDLTGQDLGGKILGPGVYHFDSIAPLTGTLTLDAGGDANAVFIFNIGSELITAAASTVMLQNGAQGGNVFFVVGSFATLGSTTAFTGRILALTSISLNNGATITCGAALARNGAVTLISNTISIPDSTCMVALAAGAFGNALDAAATENERAVAAALDAFIAAGGTLPLGFQFFASTLAPAELALALKQLSGEVGTGTAPAGMQAMDSFLDLVSDAGYGGGSLADGAAPDEANTPEENAPHTVRVLGYVSDDAPAANAAFASFGGGRGAGRSTFRRWRVWAAGFGGYRLINGDASAGTHDRTSSNFGAATGFDRLVTPDTKIGFAIAGGGTRFSLSDGLGRGKSDMFQVALYSRTNFDAAYLATVIAYALHDASTDRDITFPAVDHLSAEFIAHNLAGQIEGGYSFGWFTPYAAARGQIFRTPSYSESADTGVSVLALDYDAQKTTTIRTELGARIKWTIPIRDDASITLRARAAWAHDFWSDQSIDATFQFLPGASFTVGGAEQAHDSLLLSAGTEFSFNSGFALSGSFESELAGLSRTYRGTARLSYRW